MIAQQVAGKATRDALFLSRFDVVHLPKALIAGALVSLIAVFVMSSLLPRYGPRRIVPCAFALSAALFLVQYALLEPFPGVTSVLLYMHMTGFGVIVISGFWSLINEHFDPHSAKPRIARIAAAAALGGVLGGVLAHSVTAALGFQNMLLGLAILNVICIGATMLMGETTRGELPGEGVGKGSSGLSLIARTSYLRNMAMLLMLIAITAALLDYALKAEAARSYLTREALVSFFAMFYAVAGVAGFLLQSALGPKVLERFGIGHALAALPMVLMIGGAAGSLVTRLGTTVILRGAHAVLSNSLFRTSFELLYAPLSPFARRATKPIIDVAAERMGDMLGGGAILLLLAAAPELPSSVMLLLAAAAAGAALMTVARLHRGYVEQLAGTLRSGAVTLSDQEVLDATTRRILAETSVDAERHKVLERIKALKRDRARDKAPPPSPVFGGDDEPPPSADLEPETEHASPLLQPRESLPPMASATADLCSDDPLRVRAALTGAFMDVRLVPHLIPLLDHPDVAEDARMELRWMVPRIIGQLVDALLDPELPLTVRQRIPAVLEVSHSPRVTKGLLEGLQDEEFSVRYASARALARMRSRDSQLIVPRDVVFRAVRPRSQRWRAGLADAHSGSGPRRRIHERR